MEVINCFDTGSFRPARRTRTTTVSLNFTEISNNIKNEMKGKLFRLERDIRKVIRLSWIIPAAAAVVMLPVGLEKIFSYKQSFVKPVILDTTSETVFNEMLSTAMTEFAFDTSENFDSEGNILSESGSKQTAKILIKEPVSFKTYTVKAGDTISGICMKFGLTNISTLIAVNKINNVRTISAGQKLRVPSADGLIHTVSAGESISAVASKYNISVAELLDVNDLSKETLEKGQEIFIPGAKMDSNSLKKAMGELFTRPLRFKARVTSRFGYRKDPISGVDSSHTGIDLACPTGTPVYATMSGTVVYTGFSSIYGNYVIINHHDGYQSLYAHLSKIVTWKGAAVNSDTKIALSGNTGYSTGPHLHFSVYKNHKLVDPASLVKGF